MGVGHQDIHEETCDTFVRAFRIPWVGHPGDTGLGWGIGPFLASMPFPLQIRHCGRRKADSSMIAFFHPQTRPQPIRTPHRLEPLP